MSRAERLVRGVGYEKNTRKRKTRCHLYNRLVSSFFANVRVRSTRIGLSAVGVNQSEGFSRH
eukprot:7632301-Pyramimonas_sp.AAC.1